MNSLEEGSCLSHLHHKLIPDSGHAFNGHHHETCPGDPLRTAPEKLRTVLRQPVKL